MSVERSHIHIDGPTVDSQVGRAIESVLGEEAPAVCLYVLKGRMHVLAKGLDIDGVIDILSAALGQIAQSEGRVQ